MTNKERIKELEDAVKALDKRLATIENRPPPHNPFKQLPYAGIEAGEPPWGPRPVDTKPWFPDSLPIRRLEK